LRRDEIIDESSWTLRSHAHAHPRAPTATTHEDNAIRPAESRNALARRILHAKMGAMQMRLVAHASK
jgi:hypothetical protein